VQQRLALRPVELRGLVSEQAVEIGVASIDVGAAGDDEGLEAGGGVAEDAAEDVDDVLELLLRERLEEGGPLERAYS
jgi:hypothetical protein